MVQERPVRAARVRLLLAHHQRVGDVLAEELPHLRPAALGLVQQAAGRLGGLLADVVAQSVALVRPLAEAKGLGCDYAIDEDDRPVVTEEA